MSILTLIVYALPPPIALILAFKFIDHRAKHMHCVCPICGYRAMMDFINDEE